MTFVSWHDAQAFCEWASRESGLTICLPSEAQWEKAARGTDGRTWPWGNQPLDDKRCNYNSNIKEPSPAGMYSPLGDSPYGCADMAGNVWEWTSSLYKDYPYRAGDGREDLDADDARVLRGGAFFNLQFNVRCASRYWLFPNYRYHLHGFRVCALPPSNSVI